MNDIIDNHDWEWDGEYSKGSVDVTVYVCTKCKLQHHRPEMPGVQEYYVLPDESIATRLPRTSCDDLP